MGLSFPEAFAALMLGARVTADFLPENVFVELQKPDANSMNTEAYLKMVTVEDGKIYRCEPWHPGSRSLFSTEWKTSKYQGQELTK